MVYNARDLLLDLADGDDAWARVDEPAKLTAVLRPLAAVAHALGDQEALHHLRLLAVMRGVDVQVDLQSALAAPRGFDVRELVRLLREAGRLRDPGPLLERALAADDVELAARCAHLLASATLALGYPRLCRLYVLSARLLERSTVR